MKLCRSHLNGKVFNLILKAADPEHTWLYDIKLRKVNGHNLPRRSARMQGTRLAKILQLKESLRYSTGCMLLCKNGREYLSLFSPCSHTKISV